MRALVNQWRTNSEIINTANATIFLTPAKDTHAEVTAIFEFVRDNIRYTRDVLNVETICTPLMTITRRVGDCDDKSTLLATLAEAVGYPTRFVIGSFDGTCNYSHVWVQILTDDGWIDADACEENEPLGWAPENISCLYTEH